MKNKTFKLLVAVTSIVTFLSLFHLISLSVQSYYISGLAGAEYGGVWNDKILWMQIAIFGGRIVTGYIFYILLSIFMFKSTVGYKKGIIFPKGNIKVLYGCAVSYFLYSFTNINMDIMYATNEHYLIMDTEDVLFVLLFVTFAMMYQIAERISEENKLTI